MNSDVDSVNGRGLLRALMKLVAIAAFLVASSFATNAAVAVPSGGPAGGGDTGGTCFKCDCKMVARHSICKCPGGQSVGGSGCEIRTSTFLATQSCSLLLGPCVPPGSGFLYAN